ncbi:DUF5339 domain-containing protein [Haemophilus haemoglobinophilus]|nr:DUF5339 domain-containing protein [Canicola haemoglobinophilus]
MKHNIKLISNIFVFTLTLASFNSNAKDSQPTLIPYQCQKLFQEAEYLITEAEKQPGTHTQLVHIKNKLKQSKQQILAMDVEIQTRSCDIGLAKLHTKQ